MENSVYIKVNNPEIENYMSLGDISLLISRLRDSYSNYVKSFSSRNNMTLIGKEGNIVKEADLIVTDLKQSSAVFAFTPYSQVVGQSDMVGLANSVDTLFSEYNEEVLRGEYDDYLFLDKVVNKYSRDEIQSIFNPIFNIIEDGYTMTSYSSNSPKNIITYERKVIKEAKQYLRNNSTPNEDSNSVKIVSAIVEVSKKDNSFKKVLSRFPTTKDKAEYNGKKFIFKQPIEYEITKDEDYYVLRYKPWKILIAEKTIEELEKSFNEEIYILYEAYVEEKEANLTSDAIRLRNALIKNISPVGTSYEESL